MVVSSVRSYLNGNSEINLFVEWYAVHVSSDVDPKVNIQIHRLAGHARDSLSQTAVHAAEEAQKSLQEARSVLFGALAKQPAIVRFEALADDRHLAVDTELHDRLVREGEMLIRDSDIDGLRDLTFRIDDNIARLGAPGVAENLSGLTRA